MWCVRQGPTVRWSNDILTLSYLFNLSPLASWPLDVHNNVFGGNYYHWMTMEVEAAAMSCILPLMGILRPLATSATHRRSDPCVFLINRIAELVDREDART